MNGQVMLANDGICRYYDMEDVTKNDVTTPVCGLARNDIPFYSLVILLKALISAWVLALMMSVSVPAPQYRVPLTSSRPM